MKICRLLLLFWLAAVSAAAQDLSLKPVTDSLSRPVSMPKVRVRTIALGSGQILDTYLSPEKYNGLSLRYTVSEERAFARHRQLSQRFTHEGSFEHLRNRADNNTETGGRYFFCYGLLWHKPLFDERFRVYGGGEAEAEVGFLYNMRNQNNPAQARLAMRLAAVVGAGYRFTWRHDKTCVLGYEAAIPLAGLMFSPYYGQSYYEIFNRGNYHHNAVPTSFVNAPSFRHQLTFDFPVSRLILRVGYRGDFRQAKVNGLRYHDYSHALVIGVVSRFSVTRLSL